MQPGADIGVVDDTGVAFLGLKAGALRTPLTARVVVRPMPPEAESSSGGPREHPSSTIPATKAPTAPNPVETAKQEAKR